MTAILHILKHLVLSQSIRAGAQRISDAGKASAKATVNNGSHVLLFFHAAPLWGYLIPSPVVETQLDLFWARLESLPEFWQTSYILIIGSVFGVNMFAQRQKNKKSETSL